MSLDPDVSNLLETGQFVALDLIRFDLPGHTVGYHNGGRPFTWNGLTYLPNRWLDPGGMSQAVGTAVSRRTIVFANVPTSDPADAVARIEEFDYPNAPVIVTHLAGAPGTNEVIGILASSIYEIDRVTYSEGALSDDGVASITITIDLEPPGRSARSAPHVRRAQVEQQFDNDPNDTCLEYASVVQTVPVEWGQRGG